MRSPLNGDSMKKKKKSQVMDGVKPLQKSLRLNPGVLSVLKMDPNIKDSYSIKITREIAKHGKK